MGTNMIFVGKSEHFLDRQTLYESCFFLAEGGIRYRDLDLLQCYELKFEYPLQKSRSTKVRGNYTAVKRGFGINLNALVIISMP